MAEKDKRSSASFVPFKPLDNLFEPTIQEKPVPGDSLQNLPLDDLHAFKDHPFRLYTEDKMAEMVESIQEHGVITPILVRPANDGKDMKSYRGITAWKPAGELVSSIFLRQSVNWMMTPPLSSWLTATSDKETSCG